MTRRSMRRRTGRTAGLPELAAMGTRWITGLLGDAVVTNGWIAGLPTTATLPPAVATVDTRWIAVLPAAAAVTT